MVLRLLLAGALLLGVLVWAGADMAAVDRSGTITALNVGGESLAISARWRVPLKGWGRSFSATDATDLKSTQDGGKRIFTGSFEPEPGKRYHFEETLQEAEGKINIGLKVTADAEVPIEGVYFWLDFPIATFAGGPCSLTKAGASVADAVAPPKQPEARHFLRGEADAALISDASGNNRLVLAYSRPLNTMVQDNREYGGGTYSLFSQLTPALKAGETTMVDVTLTPTITPDTTPAMLTVDPAAVRYHLDGFGGNYCFNVESPVTQYTLKNLKIAWARTEMSSNLWEPQNDNADPQDANWAYFEAQDKPNSELRNEFMLHRQIQDMGVPYVISVWHLPPWLYADPERGLRAGRRKVPPEKWSELVECLATYLVYAKRQYGVEPDLFSFNEANIGVDVWLTAEEHRDAIKSIGARFKELGLKTKMLLADATGPRGTHTYALPAAADPEAMQYVGAVGFHSWGGGSAADYNAWGDLAERLKLPLLVTELGTDAGAYRTAAWNNYSYVVGEMRMYQELLLHARPQGTMQWEFTSDYSIVNQIRQPDGTIELQPSVRFHFVKQFCNLTPYHSDALTTTSDNPRVLVTAFSAPAGQPAAFTAHVLNTGAERSATLTGIPAGITSLRAVRTSETEGFGELPPVEVHDGKVTLTLAQQSLLTLTTIQGE
jgi:hypothetical protein